MTSAAAEPQTSLTGRWEVRRTGGLLPPLVGVGKLIEGARGWTTIGGVKIARFDVVGLELRYRLPVRGLVDVLEPDGTAGYRGRATFRGRVLGTFRLTRTDPRGVT